MKEKTTTPEFLEKWEKESYEKGYDDARKEMLKLEKQDLILQEKQTRKEQEEHINRLERCSGCGKIFYDKHCPDCIRGFEDRAVKKMIEKIEKKLMIGLEKDDEVWVSMKQDDWDALKKGEK